MSDLKTPKAYADPHEKNYNKFQLYTCINGIDPVTLCTPTAPLSSDKEIKELAKQILLGNLSNVDQNNSIFIRIGQKTFQPYEIDTAYDYYVTNKSADILTREVIPDVQLARIEIYKKFKNRFRDYRLDNNKIEILFLKFLNNNGKITDDELLQLDRFLLFNTSDLVASNLGTINKDMTPKERLLFRDIAKSDLLKLPVNSWIMRPSSIIDNETEKIYIRVISTHKIEIDDGYKYSVINDLPVIHVWGYGYCIVQYILRGQNLDNYDFRKSEGIWFPSLTKLLLYLASKNKITLSKYYRVDKSNYCKVF
jgi:hypothetical protein